MKNLIKLSFLLIAALCYACADDDAPAGGGNQPGKTVLAAFNSDFPGATDVTWSKKQNYDVAQFKMPAKVRAVAPGFNEAWYVQNGNCALSEVEVELSEVPQVILDAVKASPYVVNENYEIDDVDMLTQGDQKMYKVELEKDGGVDIDLYYDLQGKFITERFDTEEDENLPVPPKAAQYIQTNYPNAIIVETELEMPMEMWFVEIKVNDVEKEVVFDKNEKWIFTETELESFEEMPQAVQDAVAKLQPKGELDDDADLIEYADKAGKIASVYVLSCEIEQPGGEDEIDYVYIYNAEGKLLYEGNEDDLQKLLM